MSAARVEWRGDVFATDLDRALGRIRRLPVIPRPFEHTLTVFLHPEEEEELDLARVIRLRAYRNLESISGDAIAQVLEAGIAGKLQVKSTSGETRALGDVTLERQGRRFGVEGFPVRAGSVRVSQRVHYSFAPGAVAPFDAAAEAMRVTVDSDRHLFRIDGQGCLEALGQLGPRVEIKAPARETVERMRANLDPERMMKRQPNRSLELLFQDMLRRRVVPAVHGFPEMELKFDLFGGFDVDLIEKCLAALGDIRLLLPRPFGVERMRRYHLCHDPVEGDECTIVETASGRLSLKRKRHARRLGDVLLRDTSACRTTDRTGDLTSVAAFLARQKLVRLGSFEKHQTKIPFARPSGRAFLISFDHCFQLGGPVLDQVELEYIGAVAAETCSPADVAADLERLGKRLCRGALGSRLAGSSASKYGFFSGQAPSLRAS